MPRPIWSGAISFGLVSVPVKLFAAVSQKDVWFHQIDKQSGSRIRYKRVSEKTGREIPYDRIAKGYEIDDERYVVIDKEELDRFAPNATKRIDIEDFVDLEEIDPIFYEHTYFLSPDKGGDKAFALLRKAMEDSDKIGIGRVVIRTKQYLAAVRPYGKKGIALETMYFPDEIVDEEEIPGLPDRMPRVSDKELSMARKLVESLGSEFDPGKYHDEYRERVLDFLKKKAKGKTVKIEEPAEETAAVTDLMEALKASVEGKRKKARPRSKASANGRKRRSA
ncbi:MAG: Ku protein [Actinomycetota bacterium]